MKIIKRNGSEVVFDINKITKAITKANDAIESESRMTPRQIERIAESVVLACEVLGHSPSVEEVQDMVEKQSGNILNINSSVYELKIKNGSKLMLI